MKCCNCEPSATLGVVTPGGEDFYPGPEMMLDPLKLLCNKVLLKYKGIEEAPDVGIRTGAERVPPLRPC